ncbi:MAG: hypothetical protein GF400_01050 [Candidatus Eisenbacteria bacterium]|nr:hypothetical protein [Candidatus Eisenbacteria bacterium]
MPASRGRCGRAEELGQRASLVVVLVCVASFLCYMLVHGDVFAALLLWIKGS